MSSERHTKRLCHCDRVCVYVRVTVWKTHHCWNPTAWIQHPSPWTSDKKITTFHFSASRPSSSHCAQCFFTSLYHPKLSLCVSTWLAILSHVPEDGKLCSSLAGCQGSAGELGTYSDWNRSETESWGGVGGSKTLCPHLTEAKEEAVWSSKTALKE